MELTRRQLLKLGSLTGMGLALFACSGKDNGGSTSGDVKELTVDPGKLTVATGNPAWEPWVINDDPESGEGFEAALIYALAEKMGYSKDDVVWVRTEFDEACAPGSHDWDINVQQVSINEDRKKAVDFSPAYFVPTQSVLVRGDSKYADATECSDLADATFAVMVGSTADEFIKASITNGDDSNIEYYNDNSDAAAAVSNGQADALVTDTPQAVYMAESMQVEDGVVVGQIPNSSDDGLGLTLSKDSPLTPYVAKAMEELIADGTVEELVQTWLKAYTSDIPMLA